MKSASCIKASLFSLILLSACASPSSPQAPEAGYRALNKDSLRSLLSQGQKPYIWINFFSVSCNACAAELPELLEFHEEAGERVELLLIALDAPDSLSQHLGSFSHRAGLKRSPYQWSRQEAYAFIDSVYPGWDSSVPFNLLFAADGRLVDATGMTNRKEAALMLRGDLDFQP
jgi:thiol-disulfide isomerase/thioredoxin